ncbi:MAG: transposase [Paraburkholderia sp.]
MEWVVDWGLNHRELGTIRAFGVDEIQYGRGHQYLTLVYQIEAGRTRLLWVGQERTKESFAKFFAMIGKPLCEKVEFVCSDMWKPYLEMIARHCPRISLRLCWSFPCIVSGAPTRRNRMS